MLHKVSDLPMDARAVVESLIGRPLAEGESVSIRPIHFEKEGANAQAADEAADRLERYFTEIDEQHPAIAQSEIDSAIDAAMRKVRPGYLPHR